MAIPRKARAVVARIGSGHRQCGRQFFEFLFRLERDHHPIWISLGQHSCSAQSEVHQATRFRCIDFAAFHFDLAGGQAGLSQFLKWRRRSQRVLVSNSEALEKFANLTTTFWAGGELEIGSSNTEDVTRATLERVGYIDLFARMRQYVPSEIPHEDGGLMAGNLSFALIPRILNPNKGVKNDQWKVEKYAKRIIADNASFSLGHFAEHYVDYGPRGMWFSLLALWSCARTFNHVVSASEPVPGCDLIYLFLTLSLAFSYQADAIKIYGQVVWGSVFWLVIGRRIMALSFRQLGLDSSSELKAATGTSLTPVEVITSSLTDSLLSVLYFLNEGCSKVS